MRIHIENERQAVTADNAALDAQMEACQAQITTMDSVSLSGVGLTGQAFDALESRLRGRTWVLQAHYAAYNAVRLANDTNLAALGNLAASEPDGSVDTDMCQQRAQDACAQAQSLEMRMTEALAATRVSEGERGVGLATATSIQAVYMGAAEVYRTKARLYEELCERVEEYCRQTSQAYTTAYSTTSSLLNASTADVLTCVNTGAWPATMAWAHDIGERYQTACAAHRVALARPYLSEDELAAYKSAITNNGLVGATEVYGKDGLNEMLWSALVKLPDALVTDQEVSEIAKAYGAMWVAGDLTAAERFLELSYVATGNMQLVMAPPALTDPQGVPFDCSVMYEYAPSALLGRVAASATEQMRGIEKGEDIGYFNRLAGTNLLATFSERSGSLWCATKDAADFSLSTVRVGEDSNSRNAVLCVLEVNPALADAQVLTGLDNPQCVMGYETYACLSGELSDIQVLTARLKEQEAAGNFSFSGAAAKYFADESLSFMVSAFSGFGAVLVAAGGIGKELFDNWESVENAGETADAVSFASAAEKDVLNDIGFVINFHSVAPDHSLGMFEGVSDTRMYVSDAVASRLERTMQAYAASGSAPSGGYTSADLLYDLEHRTSDAMLNRDEASRTYAFLQWCEEPADLVYRTDSTDTAHSPGETVMNPPANYDYIERSNLSCSNYQFSWEYEDLSKWGE